ncbi:unnamed protein product [Pleuronectes platessa]|uniref:Uncharacterized protein n=1 Tax=Pleuronectes platessa TaxID=8262 RepID=A0A9N7UWH4_PLEPL|nr:unnamed protein product [Pleuronectes platessa]
MRSLTAGADRTGELRLITFVARTDLLRAPRAARTGVGLSSECIVFYVYLLHARGARHTDTSYDSESIVPPLRTRNGISPPTSQPNASRLGCHMQYCSSKWPQRQRQSPQHRHVPGANTGTSLELTPGRPRSQHRHVPGANTGTSRR